MHENQSPVPLPRYRCHKVVEAAKIDSVTISLVGCDAPTAVREECRTTRWLQLVGVKEPVPVTAEWYDRHKVEPGGYFVRYADGYTSFSPAAAFEEGYAPVGATASAAADPWKPSGADYDRGIHVNPDAKAWADFFCATYPLLADKREVMIGWFANAMMAMHDHLRGPACGDMAESVAESMNRSKADGSPRAGSAKSPFTVAALIAERDVLRGERDVLRGERDALRKECVEWRRMSKALFDADCQQLAATKIVDVPLSTPDLVCGDMETGEVTVAAVPQASAKSMAEQIDRDIIAEFKAGGGTVAASAYEDPRTAEDACRVAAESVLNAILHRQCYKHKFRGDLRRAREVAANLSGIARHDDDAFQRDHVARMADALIADLISNGEPSEFCLLPEDEPWGGNEPLASYVAVECHYCVRARIARDSGGVLRLVVDWAGY